MSRRFGLHRSTAVHCLIYDRLAAAESCKQDIETAVKEYMGFRVGSAKGGLLGRDLQAPTLAALPQNWGPFPVVGACANPSAKLAIM